MESGDNKEIKAPRNGNGGDADNMINTSDNGDNKDSTDAGGNGISAPVDERDALGNNRFVQRESMANTRTDKDATHYRMDHKYRGKAIVLNHEHFRVSNLRSRSGTSVDCKNVCGRLKSIGFDVYCYNDLNYLKLDAVIKEAASEDHSDADCFIMVVLSHGEQGILYAHDTPYNSELLWSAFTADKCPSLAGKPKLFFIQACQGDKLDSGVTMNRTETDGHPSDSYRIPSQADFLIAYSTIPGYYSWRNTTHGSWFMQALCRELEVNAFNQDLLTLLTTVSRRVAFDFESNVPDTPHMHRQKQIPCVTTMLTRLVKFTRKG